MEGAQEDFRLGTATAPLGPGCARRRRASGADPRRARRAPSREGGAAGRRVGAWVLHDAALRRLPGGARAARRDRPRGARRGGRRGVAGTGAEAPRRRLPQVSMTGAGSLRPPTSFTLIFTARTAPVAPA